MVSLFLFYPCFNSPLCICDFLGQSKLDVSLSSRCHVLSLLDQPLRLLSHLVIITITIIIKIFVNVIIAIVTNIIITHVPPPTLCACLIEASVTAQLSFVSSRHFLGTTVLQAILKATQAILKRDSLIYPPPSTIALVTKP